MTSQERIARIGAIEEKRAELGAKPAHAYEPPSDCVFLTTIENRFKGLRGGVTMQVGKRSAAVLIVDGSHRLSTDDEIEAYHQAEHDRRCAAQQEDDRRNRRAVIFTEPSLVDAEPAPVDEAPAAQLELEPVTTEPRSRNRLR